MKIESNTLVQREQALEQPKQVSEIEKIAIGALKPLAFLGAVALQMAPVAAERVGKEAKDDGIAGLDIVFFTLAIGLLIRIIDHG